MARSGASGRSRRTDVLSPDQRRHCMSQIKGRDTKPELLLRRSLWRLGMRYRVKSKAVGRPDIVFTSKRIAIFVDGCQWHCCPTHWVRPKSNTRFWDRKFNRNRDRDVEVTRLLKTQGWTVLRFWEHQVEAGCDALAWKVLALVEGKAASPSGRQRR